MGPASEIRTIIWDFDGVIVESNAIREQGFIKVLSAFKPQEIDALLDFHRKNGGLSRYVKFRYFFESVLDKGVTDQEVQDYAEKFSRIMRQLMTNREILIEETTAFIQRNDQTYNFHIASGSDQDELRYLCSQLEIAQYFRSINGSPKPKNEIVRDLLLLNEYEPSTTLLIGDAINDYEAAKVNGISFMAYNGSDALSDLSDIVINLSL